MGQRAGIQTKNTVQLLYQIDRYSYNQLKKEHPSEKYIFNLGDTMGDEEKHNTLEIQIKAITARKTLNAVVDDTMKFHNLIKKRIEKYKNMELALQILTALGGSTLLITLIKDFESDRNIKTFLQYISAIITTVSSLLSVLINRGLGGWSFNRRNTVHDYDKLIELKLSASRVLRSLEPKIQVFDELEDLSSIIELIDETENISEEVGKIISDYS